MNSCKEIITSYFGYVFTPLTVNENVIKRYTSYELLAFRYVSLICKCTTPQNTFNSRHWQNQSTSADVIFIMVFIYHPRTFIKYAPLPQLVRWGHQHRCDLSPSSVRTKCIDIVNRALGNGWAFQPFGIILISCTIWLCFFVKYIKPQSVLIHYILCSMW